MLKYYSYDIFDTCLVRSCGRPDIVFDILAMEVLGDTCDFTLRADFAHERKVGEQIARKRFCINGIEDVTIDQIYACCDFSLYTDIDKDIIKAHEFNLECEILRPVKHIKEEIVNHRKEGAQIIYISDMYLPSRFIINILAKYGIYQEGDKLFVSNEAGKTKISGGLYDYVAKKVGISDYHQWQHSGDNKLADIIVPRRLGIKTKQIEHNYSYYERKMACMDYTSLSFEAHKMASLSKSVLCEYGSTSRTLFAADFIAPIYVPFVQNVLDHASTHGVQHLYFFARDGYILYKIAQVLGEKYPQISLHYLYVSRDSLYLPGLEDLNIETICKCYSNVQDTAVIDILQRLQMQDFDFRACGIDDNQKGLCILQQLLNDDNFKNRLENKRLEQKELCLRYFKQEGLTRDGSAIVDLTGTRRCHVALNKILEKENDVFGYYLIVDTNREKGVNYYALNFKDRMFNNKINCWIEPTYLIENYFSATNQLRTTSYKINGARVEPVFEDNPTSLGWTKELSELNICVCKEYARRYMIIVDKCQSAHHVGIGIASLSDFLLAPDIDYIKAFEGISFSESKNNVWKVLDKSSTRYYGLIKINKVYSSISPKILTNLMRKEIGNACPNVNNLILDSQYYDILSKIRQRLAIRRRFLYIAKWAQSFLK